MKPLTIIIPPRLIGKRIDSVIAIMLPMYSRCKITNWINKGNAMIDAKPFKPKLKVGGGELVVLDIPPPKTKLWQAQHIPLNILFEDEDIMLINKPAGLVTHPGAGNWKGTLANALLYYKPSLAQLDRAGIVHRLDKNTSGLMVVACNPLAQKNLIEQLQTHAISRQYSAIVYGYMISGGTINKPIGRDPKDRLKQAVVERGKEALTHYRVIERFGHHTHIKVILETGRTHQIRLHLSHIGYPLIGDVTYGGKVRFPKGAPEALKDALRGFGRQALHAKKLSLRHPKTGKQLLWKAPLPQDMQDLIKTLSRIDPA